MNRRSIIAIVAGAATAVALSYAIDGILRAADVMDETLPATGSSGLVLVVLSYRAVFNVLGCWVAARLAPSRPMRHALVLGAIGFVVSLAGAAAGSAELGPRWYAWALAIVALPSAWLGGRLDATDRSPFGSRLAGGTPT